MAQAQVVNDDLMFMLQEKPTPVTLKGASVQKVIDATQKEIVSKDVISKFLTDMLFKDKHQKDGAENKDGEARKPKVTFIQKTKKTITRRTTMKPKNVVKTSKKVKEFSSKIVSTKVKHLHDVLDLRINRDLIDQLHNYEKPSVEIEISPYYLANRNAFKESIKRLLRSNELYQENIDEETCDPKTKDVYDVFHPMKHQMFVRDYLSLMTPYRGVLLFHGLGSGKTCTSIGIIESLKEDKKVYILTPASLKQNYISQMQFCGDKIYNSNQHWRFYEIAKTREEIKARFMDVVNKLSKILFLTPGFIVKQRGVWIIDSTQKPNLYSYDEATRIQIRTQVETSISRRFEFISYNGQLTRKDYFDKLTKKGNPFDNSVVCIDEAHNVVSGIVNRLKEPESNSMRLYHLLMDAENCKIIMLSATPLINYPNEIAVMSNILRGYIKTLEITLEVHGKKVDKSFFESLFRRYGFVDYIDFTKKEGKFTLIITKTPYGFVRAEGSDRTYEGVIQGKNTYDMRTFEVNVEKILNNERIDPKNKKSAKLFTITKKTLKRNLNLPDNQEEFEALFMYGDASAKSKSKAAAAASSSSTELRKRDPSTVTLETKHKLQRRLVGLVSYLGDKQSLMPDIKNQSIVKIPMSDYQLPKYADARRNEIKVEKKPKRGDLYSTSNSSYRTYSRAFCNFVFPEGITRPTLFSEKIKDVDLSKIDEDFADIVDDTVKDANLEGKFEEGSPTSKMADKLAIYYEKIRNVLGQIRDRSDEFLTPENLINYSPKFLKILENIIDEEHLGSHLLYSHFRTVEGIEIFKMVLEQNGFVELALRKNGAGEYVLNIPEDKLDYPKFALYTGMEDSDEREVVRNIFNNDWEQLSKTLRQQVESLQQNEFGQVCKLLMITSSGAEGINLRNVRYVHIMEPYWHPVRIEQVIGRARRICSHQSLPIEYQNIETFLYVSTLSDEQKTKKEFKELVNTDKNLTSDESLLDIMDRKHRINQTLLQALKEVSIDCTLNMDKSEAKACFRIPDTASSSDYLTRPSYLERSGEAKVQEKKTRYKIHEGDKLIDADLFEQDGTVKVVGKVVMVDGKKKYKLYKK